MNDTKSVNEKDLQKRIEEMCNETGISTALIKKALEIPLEPCTANSIDDALAVVKSFYDSNFTETISEASVAAKDNLGFISAIWLIKNDNFTSVIEIYNKVKKFISKGPKDSFLLKLADIASTVPELEQLLGEAIIAETVQNKLISAYPNFIKEISLLEAKELYENNSRNVYFPKYIKEMLYNKFLQLFTEQAYRTKPIPELKKLKELIVLKERKDIDYSEFLNVINDAIIARCTERFAIAKDIKEFEAIYHYAPNDSFIEHMVKEQIILHYDLKLSHTKDLTIILDIFKKKEDLDFIFTRNFFDRWEYVFDKEVENANTKEELINLIPSIPVSFEDHEVRIEYRNLLIKKLAKFYDIK